MRVWGALIRIDKGQSKPRTQSKIVSIPYAYALSSYSSIYRLRAKQLATGPKASFFQSDAQANAFRRFLPQCPGASRHTQVRSTKTAA